MLIEKQGWTLICASSQHNTHLTMQTISTTSNHLQEGHLMLAHGNEHAKFNMDDYFVANEMNPSTQTNATPTISMELIINTTMEQHKETFDSLTTKVAHDAFLSNWQLK
jgi:hypothetical protein